MPDNYSGNERRQWAAHCPNHDERTQQVSKLMADGEAAKSQISDLYDKHEETRKLLAEIKNCVEVLNVSVNNGFTRQNSDLGRLRQDIEGMAEKWEARRIYADGIVEQARERFNRVEQDLKRIEGDGEKYKWVLDWANDLKNNTLPYIIKRGFWAACFIALFMISLHWLDIGKLLEMALRRGK